MSTAGTNALKVVGEQAQDAAEHPARIPRLNERLTEELVIALVGPVGSGCTTTFATLKEILSDGSHGAVPRSTAAGN